MISLQGMAELYVYMNIVWLYLSKTLYFSIGNKQKIGTAKKKIATRIFFLIAMQLKTL